MKKLNALIAIVVVSAGALVGHEALQPLDHDHQPNIDAVRPSSPDDDHGREPRSDSAVPTLATTATTTAPAAQGDLWSSIKLTDVATGGSAEAGQASRSSTAVLPIGVYSGLLMVAGWIAVWLRQRTGGST